MRDPVTDSFDIFEYVAHLRTRWRIPVLAIVTAGAMAALITMLVPKKYTATVSILIEPPGVTDVRVATAVSPVYLESLRSYERFGASDSLFAEAVKRFGLQDSQGLPPIESLKRRVLRVSKPRDTRILELSATLPNPQKAHELSLFLAERTVELNRSENISADREMLDEARRQVADAQQRLTAAQNAAAEDGRLDHPDAISDSMRSNLDVLSEVREKLISDEASLAEYDARLQAAAPGDLPYERRQAAALKARAATMRERVNELARMVDRQKAAVATRTARLRSSPD